MTLGRLVKCFYSGFDAESHPNFSLFIRMHTIGRLTESHWSFCINDWPFPLKPGSAQHQLGARRLG